MLNKKEIRIVQLLIEDKGKYVTSHELAKQLSCSDRTIRTYYKSLVEKLADNSGIEIISKQGRGYKLLVSDEEAYDYFLKENKPDEIPPLRDPKAERLMKLVSYIILFAFSILLIWIFSFYRK